MMRFVKKHLMSMMATLFGLTGIFMLFADCSIFRGNPGATGFEMIFGYEISSSSGTARVLNFSPGGFIMFLFIIAGIVLSWVPKMHFVSCILFIVGAILLCFLPNFAVWNDTFIEIYNMSKGLAPSAVLYAIGLLFIIGGFFAAIKPFILIEGAE